MVKKVKYDQSGSNVMLKEAGLFYTSSLYVTSPRDVAYTFGELARSDREKFLCISLDENQKILGCEVVSIGSLNSSLVHPREVFKTPVLLNAKKIVLVHNHPTGDPTPSEDDLEITARLIKAAKLFNMQILYHIIIGHGKYHCLEYSADGSLKKNSTNQLPQAVTSGLLPVKQYEVNLNLEQTSAGGETQQETITIASPEDVVKYVKPLFTEKDKASFVLLLDSRLRVLSVQYLGQSEKDITSEKLARLAVCMNACSMILTSNFDISNKHLKELKTDMKTLGVELQDCVCVNTELTDKNIYVSKARMGVLSEKKLRYRYDVIDFADEEKKQAMLFSIIETDESEEVKPQPLPGEVNRTDIETLALSKDTFTAEEKEILATYTGGGGQKDTEGRGILDEYYTPETICGILTRLAAKQLSPQQKENGLNILEPSVGKGNFLKYLPGNASIDCYEINPVAAKITSVLYPDAIVHNQPFESIFVDDQGNKKQFDVKYDLVIGNPPYGNHRGLYRGLGEEPKINRYEEYFIKRSLDITKEGGIVAMVLPSGFMNSKSDYAKREIARQGKLIEAYRLPSGVFDTTEIGVDLVIFQKNHTDDQKVIEERAREISDGEYFVRKKENIIGTERTRIGRYGPEKFIDGTYDDIYEHFVDLLSEPLSDVWGEIQKPEKVEVKTEETKKEIPKPVLTEESYVITAKKDDEVVSLMPPEGLDEQEIELWNHTTPTGELDPEYVKERYANIKDIKEFYDHRVNWMTEGKPSDGKRKFYNNFNYFQGNIYDKLEQLEKDKPDMSPEQYEKQRLGLERVLPPRMTVQDINLPPTDDLVRQIKLSNGDYLIDRFRDYIDELPWEAFQGSSSYEVMGYINKTPVYGIDPERNAQVRKRRREVGNMLFRRFILEELSPQEQKIIEDVYNRKRNAVYTPDYSNIPLISRVNKHFKDDVLKLADWQRSGIGFLVTKGVGCLAHEVGAGKTLSAIVATHELMTRGWCKRPLFVVPQSVYQKWIDEISEAIPNVKINALSNLSSRFKGDISNLTIEDGTISVVTIEGFQKIINFKRETEIQLLSRLRDTISLPDMTKRQQAQMEAKTEEILGKGKRGTARVYFEDLGFDHIVFDEAHRYKNIFSGAKMSKGESNEYRNVQGGRTSRRGIKAYLASQYILEKNNGRGVFLLTATPFTNSPLEYYSMLSLVAKRRMEEMGLTNVNAFMTAFMDLQTRFVVKADRTLQEEDVIERFRNNKQLRMLVGEFFDFKDGEDIKVKRPDKTRKKVIIPPTDLQYQLMQKAEELFNDQEAGGAIVAITELQNITLSPYLSRFSPGGPADYKEFVNKSPKIRYVMEAIKQIKEDKPEVGQIIYMPRGIEYHGMLKEYLVKELGYKPEEVEIVSGLKNSSENAIDEIQDKFNAGEIKVLIGSDVIKEGVDLQENTTDVYVLHLPWNPTDLTQIEGRAWRQGNQWKNVRIVYPLIENSVDPFTFQKLETKEKRIKDVRDKTANEVDVSDINFEELKLDLITNPVLRLKAERTLKLAEERKKLTEMEADRAFMVRTVENIEKETKKMEEYKFYSRNPDDEYTKRMIEKFEARIKKYMERIGNNDLETYKKRIADYAKEISKQEEKINNIKQEYEQKIHDAVETKRTSPETYIRRFENSDAIEKAIAELKEENKTFFEKFETETGEGLPSLRSTSIPADVEEVNTITSPQSFTRVFM